MDDYDAIKATVLAYFEGYRTKNRELLERAFATDVANMMGYWRQEDGNISLTSKPIKDLIEIWVSPDFEPHELSNGEVLSIDIFSPIGATAVFDCGGKFLDTFQLAKIDGTWRIVNKFFVDK
jgi:hypothetical protein